MTSPPDAALARAREACTRLRAENAKLRERIRELGAQVSDQDETPSKPTFGALNPAAPRRIPPGDRQ